MTNKIRDKNVGSIEKISQTSDKNIANIENDANTLKELAKKLRETSKINRYISLGKKIKETNKYYIMSETELIPTAEAIEEVLAEREQKDKQIQELEEELSKYKDIDYMFKIDSNENRVDMKKIYFEWLDSIPKQVVIDKIEEYDKKMTEDAGYPYWVITDRIVMNVLQELLETK